MKFGRIFRRMAALAVTLTLLFSIAPAEASTTLRDSALVISDGLEYTELTYLDDSQNKQQAFVFEYTPGQSTQPYVAYGGKLYGRSNISYIADQLISDGMDPVAGINADFFELDTGLPCGLVVTDGILRSSSSYNNAVGVMPDGSMFIGTPALSIFATSDKSYVEVLDINKKRTSDGIYLYTSDFSAASHVSGDGYEVLLYSAGGTELRIGQSVTLKVVSSGDVVKNRTLGDGYMLLSATEKGGADKLKAFSVGDQVTITVSSQDERWSSVEYAVGGGAILASDGVLSSDIEESDDQPRTILGVKSNGAAVVMAVDGRQSGYSSGMSYEDASNALLAMGCVGVINMDGGGSTTAGVKWPGTDDFTITNSSSDGTPRQCANYLFFLNSARSSGIAERLFIYPHDGYILAGASLTVETKATDSEYCTVGAQSNITYSATAGAFSGDTYTAPAEPGDVVLSVTDGNAYGETTIHVVDAVDSISITKDGTAVGDIDIDPGESAKLSAEAVYNNQNVYCDGGQLIWSVSGDAGTIGLDGMFTAAAARGLIGNVIVSYGGESASVAVSTGAGNGVIADFADSAVFSASVGAGSGTVSPSLNTDYTYVRSGNTSLKLDYDFSFGDTADASGYVALANSYDYVNLWVYGDGSGTGLALKSSGGTTQAQPIDFEGWRMMSFTGVSGSISGIQLTKGADDKGDIYIDRIIGTFGSSLIEDRTVSARIDGVSDGVVTAYAKDTSGTVISASNITLTVDGRDMEFNYDILTGVITAVYQVNEELSEHIITVTAVSLSGDIARDVMILEGGEGTGVFADMDDHWAKKYVELLSANGALAGATTGDKVNFNPDTKITREEMATVVVRFLGLDTDKYETVQLPYKDADSIALWALPYVRTMYAEGLMIGQAESDGTYFNPESNLTRMEAVTILGRMLPQGYDYEEKEFTDGSDIAAWASPHVAKLTGLGAINGYTDGSFKPSNNITRAEISKILYMLY